MFNSDAIKKWANILSPECTIDPKTYLICSIIPLSYIQIVGGNNLIIVDLEDIRKHTNLVKEGCDYLISIGFAKWVTYGIPNHQEPYDKISIGSSDSIMDNPTYYFEQKKKAFTKATAGKLTGTTTKKANVSKKTTVKSTEDYTADFGNTIQILDDWFAKYQKFCLKVNLNSKATKVYDKVKDVIGKAKKGKMTSTDVLIYLDCVNAMIYDWIDIPSRYNNIKLKQVAKKVLVRTTNDNIIKLIPYYVENYPSTAKVGYEETNIYNLDFHFNSMLLAMNKNKPKTKTNFEDDGL